MKVHNDLDLDIWPVIVLGCASMGLGLAGLLARDFAFQWQPVPADTPWREALALLAAGAELVAGALIIWRPTRSAAGVVLASLSLLWSALHLPRLAGAPLSVEVWLSVAEPMCIFIGAMLLVARFDASKRGAFRAWTIAMGATFVVFGLSHVAYADFTASMVPSWLPFPLAVAYLTGLAHAAAGIGVIAGVLRGTALALEAMMMASFAVLLHVPRVLAAPGERLEWTMLLVACALSASVLAAFISDRRVRRGGVA